MEGERQEWKEKVIQIRRVTKVVKGGKKLSFRAVVVVGNEAGQVGLGVGKSGEVIGAIQKAVAAAKKDLVEVPIHAKTIPHPIRSKAGGSVVVLRQASEGTGVIAGGAARAVIELAGIENILSKSLGSNSPLNVARATIKGLKDLRTFRQIAEARGKTVQEILN
ncbi:MAG: 30S ribosomal protein S5 [Vampirovibrionales bacterium]|nr:30S ribosomal protein S5 [Vampirovibrionales bacterium]